MLALAINFPDLAPEIFVIEVAGREFALRWYALAYIVGILIGWFIASQLFKRGLLWRNLESPMTSEQVSDLVTWIILGVVLGGRLGFVLFYQPAYYLSNPLEILKIWEGGMSFHGGALGVLTAGLIFCWKNKLSALKTGDVICVATPPALLLGRIANFVNAELWGRETSLPWGVIFPGDAAQACATLTEACARHPSQLYEAALEGLVLGCVMLWFALRRDWLRTPGALIGMFLAGYGIGRFIVEFVRQPDAQFTSLNNPLGYALQFGDFGLTMGQCLSLPMIIVGFGIIKLARRGVSKQST